MAATKTPRCWPFTAGLVLRRPSLSLNTDSNRQRCGCCCGPGVQTLAGAVGNRLLRSAICVLIELALSGSYLGWGTIAVAGDEPGFVVASSKLDKRGSQLLDGVEGFATTAGSTSKVWMKRSGQYRGDRGHDGRARPSVLGDHPVTRAQEDTGYRHSTFRTGTRHPSGLIRDGPRSRRARA